jgi:hypothetical protein
MAAQEKELRGLICQLIRGVQHVLEQTQELQDNDPEDHRFRQLHYHCLGVLTGESGLSLAATFEKDLAEYDRKCGVADA